MNSNNSVLLMIGCEVDDWDSVPHSGGIFFFTTTYTPFGAHPVSYSISTGKSSCHGKVSRSVKLTIHLHLIRIYRMNGAFTVIPSILFHSAVLKHSRIRF
jgi:hypothetical protein